MKTAATFTDSLNIPLDEDSPSALVLSRIRIFKCSTCVQLIKLTTDKDIVFTTEFACLLIVERFSFINQCWRELVSKVDDARPLSMIFS